MSHYYTDNKNLDSNKKEFTYYFANKVFTFTTDNGVFSKNNVDYGSYVLIKTIYKLDLGNSLLDYGSGYGPIGIILKTFNPHLEVDMVDVNSRAIDLARINCQNHKLDITANVCEDISQLHKKFDTVVLNPPIRAGKKVIYDLYHKAKEVLNDDGHFYIVIRKAQGGNSSKAMLETIFKNVMIINKDKGYYVIDSHN